MECDLDPGLIQRARGRSIAHTGRWHVIDECVSDCDPDILDEVVPQVTLRLDLEVEASVPGEGGQHMVEEGLGRIYPRLRVRPIDREPISDPRLPGLTQDLGHENSLATLRGSIAPVHTDIRRTAPAMPARSGRSRSSRSVLPPPP